MLTLHSQTILSIFLIKWKAHLHFIEQICLSLTSLKGLEKKVCGLATINVYNN